MASPTIVFDVDETLLDTSALDPLFADAFGDKSLRRAWFGQTLTNAMSATIVGTYAPFGDMAAAALEMTARRRGVNLDDERRRKILGGMSSLPPHGDVVDGLTALRDAGYRLAALTNSTLATGEAQLSHAKLRPFFEALLSADEVRHFKPAREVYLMAAGRLSVAPEDVLLVSVHDWDVTGALRTGLDAAFVARHGTSLNPLQRVPSIVEPDLRALAKAILERHGAADNQTQRARFRLRDR